MRGLKQAPLLERPNLDLALPAEILVEHCVVPVYLRFLLRGEFGFASAGLVCAILHPARFEAGSFRLQFRAATAGERARRLRPSRPPIAGASSKQRNDHESDSSTKIRRRHHRNPFTLMSGS